MQTDYDVIVIGAGHNGLVCGSYLARAGFKTLILERREFVGGATATEELFPGYRLSSCSYICHLFQPKIIDELELRRHGFDVFQLDPARFQPYPDGRALLLWEDIDRTQEELAKFSPQDAKSFLSWQAFWKRAATITYPHFLKAPPTIEQVAAGLSGDDEVFFRKLLTVSMTDLVCEFFDDEAIRGAFIQAQDVGDPSAVGSAWCYTHIKNDLFSRPEDVGIVRGGMGALAHAIASAAMELGADILTNASVDTILTEEGRAIGVRLADGRELTSRVVISNVDPKRTFGHLVESTDLPSDFSASVSRLKTQAAYLKFHAALRRLPDFSRFFQGDWEPQWLASQKICPSIDYFCRAWNDASEGRPARAPVMEIQIPSVYDDTLTAAGQHVMSVWGLYAPVELAEGTWETQREEVGEALLDTIAIYAPDVRDCIVDWSLFTPKDIEARVGMTDGNIRHLDTIPEQFFNSRPLHGWSDYGTPVKGLYLCGAGTHPGGEVSGAPGHNAAHHVIDRES